MFTRPEPLTYFKFQYSVNRNGNRFSNTVIDKLPHLGYRFTEGDNWNANDYRIKNKVSEMDAWFKKYWATTDANRVRNDVAYEEDLEKAILNAYEAVKENWNKKLEKDFEKEFAEDLVKFLNSKSTP